MSFNTLAIPSFSFLGSRWIAKLPRKHEWNPISKGAMRVQKISSLMKIIFFAQDSSVKTDKRRWNNLPQRKPDSNFVKVYYKGLACRFIRFYKGLVFSTNLWYHGTIDLTIDQYHGTRALWILRYNCTWGRLVRLQIDSQCVPFGANGSARAKHISGKFHRGNNFFPKTFSAVH